MAAHIGNAIASLDETRGAAHAQGEQLVEHLHKVRQQFEALTSEHNDAPVAARIIAAAAEGFNQIEAAMKDGFATIGMAVEQEKARAEELVSGG